MDLVVDANILFAALIKDGATANLMFLEDLHLFAPEFLLDEFSKYEEEILEKTSRTKADFERVRDIFSRLITFIPKEEISGRMKEAEEISPDIDDSQYFALAFLIGAAVWSNETRLKNQDKIKVYSTKDLVKIFT